jgi:exonuclease VII large subunit
VITRGGGDSIRNLDHPQLISAVTSCAAATAIAVGHEADTLVLEQVADISFGTPSKFGGFLRRVAEEKRLRLQIAKSGTADSKKQGGNVLSWIFRFGQNGTHVSERRRAC